MSHASSLRKPKPMSCSKLLNTMLLNGFWGHKKPKKFDFVMVLKIVDIDQKVPNTVHEPQAKNLKRPRPQMGRKGARRKWCKNNFIFSPAAPIGIAGNQYRNLQLKTILLEFQATLHFNGPIKLLMVRSKIRICRRLNFSIVPSVNAKIKPAAPQEFLTRPAAKRRQRVSSAAKTRKMEGELGLISIHKTETKFKFFILPGSTVFLFFDNYQTV